MVAIPAGAPHERLPVVVEGFDPAGGRAMFGVGQALLLVVLPGGSHLGPVTPTGHRPRYRVNGVAAFAVTWILLVLVAGPLDLVSPELLAHRGRSE